MLNLCCAPLRPALAELGQVKTLSPISRKHKTQLGCIILALTLTFRQSEVLDDVDLVRVLGVEGGGVVLDDAPVENPLDPGHGVPGDLAAQRGVSAGPPHHSWIQHLHLRLAGEVLGADLGPHLPGDPLWLVAHRLRGVRQQILLDHKVPKLFEFTVTGPGVVMQ